MFAPCVAAIRDSAPDFLMLGYRRPSCQRWNSLQPIAGHAGVSCLGGVGSFGLPRLISDDHTTWRCTMKPIAAALLLCSSSIAASAATPERVQFVGSVQHDDMAPISFDLQLPSRQATVLQLADGSTLELATPGAPVSPEGASIRLLSPSGQVLHSATVPDPGMASKSFAYRVCRGQVTYLSPAPAVVPACGA